MPLQLQTSGSKRIHAVIISATTVRINVLGWDLGSVFRVKARFLLLKDKVAQGKGVG